MCSMYVVYSHVSYRGERCSLIADSGHGHIPRLPPNTGTNKETGKLQHHHNWLNKHFAMKSCIQVLRFLFT